MGVLFKQHLSGERIYACSGCRTHAADHQEMVSKVCSPSDASSTAGSVAAKELINVPSCTASKASLRKRKLQLNRSWCASAGVPRPPRSGLPLQQRVSVPRLARHQRSILTVPRQRCCRAAAAARPRLPFYQPAASPPHRLTALRCSPCLLFCSVNVTLGPREDRLLMTGLHTVADIHCTTCGAVLGWKYEMAFEESQKYKEGKFIIEKAKVLKVRARQRRLVAATQLGGKEGSRHTWRRKDAHAAVCCAGGQLVTLGAWRLRPLADSHPLGVSAHWQILTPLASPRSPSSSVYPALGLCS